MAKTFRSDSRSRETDKSASEYGMLPRGYQRNKPQTANVYGWPLQEAPASTDRINKPLQLDTANDYTAKQKQPSVNVSNKETEFSLHAKKNPEKHCAVTPAAANHDDGFSQLM